MVQPHAFQYRHIDRERTVTVRVAGIGAYVVDTPDGKVKAQLSLCNA